MKNGWSDSLIASYNLQYELNMKYQSVPRFYLSKVRRNILQVVIAEHGLKAGFECAKKLPECPGEDDEI